MGKRKAEGESVPDAMESVLEETLRLNRHLEAKVAELRAKAANGNGAPQGPSRRLIGGIVTEE